MKKWKRVAAFAVVLLIVLLVIPFLIPISSYVRQAEQIASAELGVPVNLSSMRFSILTTPRVNVSGIMIGEYEELCVAEVADDHALTSMFSETKVLYGGKDRIAVCKG